MLLTSSFLERKENPVIGSSSVQSISENLFSVGKANKFESMSDIEVVNENITKSTSTQMISPKRQERLDTHRSPLSQMCPNRQHDIEKESPVRKKLKAGSPVLLSSDSSFLQEEKLETSCRSHVEETNDDKNSLMQQLPEMSLNSVKKEHIDTNDAYCHSVSFISSPPKGLSTAPWFPCHKAGGLLYPGRRMKMVRQHLEQWIADYINVPSNIFPYHKRSKEQRQSVDERKQNNAC